MSRLRLLKGGELFESVVPLNLDKVTDVSRALQQYTLESEQVLTFYSLAVVMEGSEIKRAGGMLIQALPEMRHEHLEKMTAALEQAPFEDLIIAGEDPVEATQSLLSSLHIQAIGNDPLSYQCRCSKEAAIQAIMTLNEEELDALKDGGEELVTCAFCGSQYPVTAKDL
jgi:molecular chaperone Hsp33